MGKSVTLQEWHAARVHIEGLGFAYPGDLLIEERSPEARATLSPELPYIALVGGQELGGNPSAARNAAL